MVDQLPDWVKSTGGLVVGGGAVSGLAALIIRQYLLKYVSTDVEIKSAAAHGAIYEQMQKQMQRLDAEHQQMHKSLTEAEERLLSLQKQVLKMDLMLSKMHFLLVANDVDVPEYVHEYFRREVI